MRKQIHDERHDKGEPWGFIACTDSFLSGWGKAPNRSLYVLAVRSPREADVVLANAIARCDMKRPRIVSGRYLSTVRLYPGDHVKVVDHRRAERWYYTDEGWG
jgi:hypothetical protein